MNDLTLKIEMLPTGALKPYQQNARRHSKKQIRQIANSISRFGFTNPVLIGDESEIIAGHGRVMAAKELGLARVPESGYRISAQKNGVPMSLRTTSWR